MAELHWVMDDAAVDWDALSHLYRIAPLGEKAPADLRASFGASRYKCFVYDGALLVGAGRALADGVDCSYLCDVAVHPERQGLGIGKAIIQRLRDLSEGHRKIILYANPGKEEFYLRLGFRPMNTAMAIFRDGARALATGLVREVPVRAAQPQAALEGPVTLREVTQQTVGPVIRLSVAEHQKGFVAANAISFAQALFEPAAWYRAIYKGDTLAGFVMLEDQSLRTPAPADPQVGVWRFMVDHRFQGQGIGRDALRLVIEHVRRKGIFRSLELSYVPGPGSPEGFYRALGFQDTGRLDGIEVVLSLPLVP